ncbi:hypothetical protein UFOVP221_9 [uncultured Caudovirales phage]|uniref:Uncharacterized protein n=1 Tax=uncultured Caudovirales phage TaxID=2100421 RepID=A0A6J7WQE4_9CAUD|nr:hypothetical protein UFOVP221_9 [uncultured Caudovirales phage]
MPASEARKARRAARPEAGLPQATPTIASDLGDQNVGARRVVARKTEPGGPVVFDKPQEESEGKVFEANPGAPLSSVTAGNAPLSPHHTDLMNLIGGLRTAADSLIEDDAQKNGIHATLDRAVRHIHNSAEHHVAGRTNEAVSGMAAAVGGISNATSLITSKTPGAFRYGNMAQFGVLEKAFPTSPTQAANNTLQDYIGGIDGARS